jgi:hypothetical protein
MAENLNSDLKKTSNSSNLKLKLSGRCFDKGFEIFRDSGFHGKEIRDIYKFVIDLDVNPDFLYCDLKDEIEFFQKEDIIFRGIIKDFLVDGKKVKIVANGVERKLDYISIKGAVFSRYLSLWDMLSLLITPSEEIRLGNIQGFHDTTPRDFIVIVPVRNLAFKEHINIGNVEFYNDFNTIDDKIIKKTDFGKNDPDWIVNFARARVITNASEFRTALFDGYSKISTAIDLVTLRNDLSFQDLT